MSEGGISSSDFQESIETSDVRNTLIARKGPTVIELIKGGMTPSRAGEVAEVSKNTVGVWIRRGLREQKRIEDGLEPTPSEKIYLDFTLGALKAESEAQAGLVLSWFKEARQGDWKAAERFLAKRWPTEWGDNNTVKLEVSAFSNEPENSRGAQLQDDEVRQRAVSPL